MENKNINLDYNAIITKEQLQEYNKLKAEEKQIKIWISNRGHTNYNGYDVTFRPDYTSCKSLILHVDDSNNIPQEILVILEEEFNKIKDRINLENKNLYNRQIEFERDLNEFEIIKSKWWYKLIKGF